MTGGAASVGAAQVSQVAPAVPAGRRLNRKILIGACLVAVIALAGLAAPLLTSHSPTAQDVTNRLASPSSEHWLGTDMFGRDVYARLLYAARIDIPLSLAAALLPAIIGILLGAIAGYRGGAYGTIVMRSADFVQAFPVYVFLIAVVFVVGPGAKSFLVASAAISWVTYARLIRADMLRVRELDYIRAARIAGLGHRRVLFRHALPNALPQSIIYFASDVVLALVGLASLSFLGLGIQPPAAEWGSMIAEGQRFLRDQWWLSVAPGLAIVTVGVGFLLISEGLADTMGAET